jgi:methyltransferase FkbM-like protein
MRSAPRLSRVRGPVRALDRFRDERGITGIDLMKVDTESTEADVLAGLRETLGRDRPWVFCEDLKGRGSEGPLDALLRPLDYRDYQLTPYCPVLRSPREGHPTWLNYLFVPAGRGLS